MLTGGVGAILALGLNAGVQSFKFFFDVLLELIEAAAVRFADFSGFFDYGLLQAREPRFVVPHLGPEQDVSNLVNVARSALNDLGRAGLTLSVSGFGVAALWLLGWVHIRFSCALERYQESYCTFFSMPQDVAYATLLPRRAGKTH